MSQWKGRRVLVTGVCGTVGREILEQLLEIGPEEIVGIDNNESLPGSGVSGPVRPAPIVAG
jgi:FlaA1/EpsC-like NDP-sugar epimerase